DGDPVHDVSIHVQGPIAAAAQVFVNETWATPCGPFGNIVGLRGNSCPQPFVPSQSAGQGNVRMIGVGRLASFGRDPSDVALPAMMDAAHSTIRISQQDLGSVPIPVLGLGVFPEAYLDAFTRAAARGVDVEIVVSNPRSFGGHGRTQEDSYSNGWDLQSVWNA